MKNIFRFIWLILIVGLVITNYSKVQAEDSPSEVVKQFHTAMVKGNIKAMAELTDIPEILLTFSFEKDQKAHIAKGDIVKIEETIDGNIAIVKIIYKNGSIEEGKLIKIDGKWKIKID